jgi:hypothetical protein
MNLSLFDEPIVQAIAATGRVSHDFYPTPEGLTRSLLTACPQLPEIIFEPCAGNGAISDVLKAAGKEVESSDLNWTNEHGEYFYPQDATTVDFWESWKSTNLLLRKHWATATNPPFNAAHEILPLAFEYSPWGCAFLLRLSYLEPAGNRADWLQNHADHLRRVIPVNPRPRFRRDKNSKDNVTVAWMIWEKSWSWQKIGIECPFMFCNDWR